MLCVRWDYLEHHSQKEFLHTIQGGKYYDHQSERLERGQPTSNSVNINVDATDARYRQYAGIGEFSPIKQNEGKSEGDEAIDVTPENG